MKKILLILLLFLSLCSFGQKVRKNIYVPDIAGYKTLKCDFHIHTMFSDGHVWPKYRIEEAWLDGLDVISITDHLEYKPFKKYLSEGNSNNMPYLIAAPDTFYYGVKLIKGNEITKKFPPGHFNAIFTMDDDSVFNEDWEISLKNARSQNAFIMWNHPNWYTKKWEWPQELQKALDNNLIDGMEIFNGKSFYKEALDFCQEHNITMFANTDIHTTTALQYKDYKIRPMTLVFTKDNSLEEIKKSLLAKRTLAFFKDTLAGNENFMKELFNASIEYNKEIVFVNNIGYLQITNSSDIPFTLTNLNTNNDYRMKEQFTIPAHSTIIERISIKDNLQNTEQVSIRYKVENCLVRYDKRIEIDFTIKPIY